MIITLYPDKAYLMKNILLAAFAVFLTSVVTGQDSALSGDVYAAVDVSRTETDPPAGTNTARKTTKAATDDGELSDEDYKLMEYVYFLQDSPGDKQTGKRRQAANYLGWYLNKTVELNLSLENKMPFLHYGESVPMFMAGYIEFMVSHPIKNEDAANLAGIRSVIAYYKDNKEALGRDELLEKLVDLDEKGRLPAYMKRKLG